MSKNSMPNHVAIIMDGNRRWAVENNKMANEGHQYGSEAIDTIVRAALEKNLNWLTLFAFSTENWKRPDSQIQALMAVFRRYAMRKGSIIVKNNIRLRVVGDFSRFDEDIIVSIRDMLTKTTDHNGLNLTVALGYGGQDDIMLATRAIAADVAAGKIAADKIDTTLLKNYLATNELPPVDLLVRTGREQRVSNFLLWDIAYAELAFTDTLWPDFTAEEFSAIIADYAGRERRFGTEIESLESSHKE